MADASAVALGELLLRDDSSGLLSSWTETLLADPPLTLWVAWMAQRADAGAPDSLGQLAQWFARHAVEVLQWEPGAPTCCDSDPRLAEGFSDRVAVATQVSQIAARWIAEQGEAARARASLLGLLDDAPGWLALSEDAPSGDAEACLPCWLIAAGREASAAGAVDAASEVVRGAIARRACGPIESDGLPAVVLPAVSPPLAELPKIELDAILARGEEARRRWLASADPAAGWLPALTAKLARLAALENRFDEVVEAEKLEAMAEFAAGAGHEINNPLAVIAGRAQLFLREETDPERRRALALVNAQAMRIYEMIADMRLFARPPQPEPRRLDLVALVDRLIEEMTPGAAQQETSLGRGGDPGPLEIEADPIQLMVALRALCQNALEAVGHRGHIEISVRRADGGIEVSVRDDGPGISAEQRRHLFDPYYSARQAGRGLGLGLSKCWRIVTLHGGRIDVQSGAGQGAVFTIHLPQPA